MIVVIDSEHKAIKIDGCCFLGQKADVDNPCLDYCALHNFYPNCEALCINFNVDFFSKGPILRIDKNDISSIFNIPSQNIIIS